MIRKLDGRFVTVLAVAVVLTVAVTFVGRQAPADAESISVIQGRYQFIDLSSEAEFPGDHIAIFDTQTGVLQEWVGKKNGEIWTYSITNGREVARRSITVR